MADGPAGLREARAREHGEDAGARTRLPAGDRQGIMSAELQPPTTGKEGDV